MMPEVQPKPPGDAPPLRVLLVENDPLDAELAERELARAGFNLATDLVQTPEELERRFRPGAYDVVLADYNLPGWNGMDALAYLRERGDDVPFILVSGALGEEAAVECIKHGAWDYVLKNRLGRLPVAVRRALDERALMVERVRAESQTRRLNQELERRVGERTAELEAVNRQLRSEISERERAQAEQSRLLRQTETAEARFRGLLESAPYPIVISNPGGRIVLVNRRTEEVFGYHRDELLGKPIEQLVPERLRKPYLEGLARFGSSRERRAIVAEGLDLYAQGKNGTEFPVEIGLSPMESHGEILVMSIIRDITERKRAADELEVLRHQQEVILNSAGEGITRVDPDNRCTFINPAAAKALGWEASELVGRPIHVLVHHSKADGSAYPMEECPVRASLEDGLVRSADDEVFWRKDGRSFPVEYVSTPVVEKGKVVGAVVTFRDVTERRAVERMKEEFISVVSHELRTPLTSIRGALGLLASGKLAHDSPGGQRMLNIAVAATDRLMRLINDILDLERVASGRVTMAKRPCDAAELMIQAVEVMRPMAENAGIVLSVAPQAVELWADPDRIIQTLTNLLSNAIKFSSEGTTVRLDAERRRGKVLFRVKDSGRGIPKDKLESIFGRFQQVDASDARKKGGTGLGLAICRSIVRQHGGRIWAESALGRGSTFFFTLPVRQDEGSLSRTVIPAKLVLREGGGAGIHDSGS